MRDYRNRRKLTDEEDDELFAVFDGIDERCFGSGMMMSLYGTMMKCRIPLAELQTMSDRQLLRLPMIGPRRLDIIRSVIPGSPAAPDEHSAMIGWCVP